MALPTNGTLLATSAERKKLFERAAKRIVEMVLEFDKVGEGHGLLPREIVTQDSVDNSMILDMAMGGSTNTVLHMLAVARESGTRVRHRADQPAQPADAQRLQGGSPSSHYHMEDVHNSGGIHTILGSRPSAASPDLLKTRRAPR